MMETEHFQVILSKFLTKWYGLFFFAFIIWIAVAKAAGNLKDNVQINDQIEI
jgi:hypothetical protein